LGHQIHAARSPLQAEILDVLVRAPGSRYSELQPLLRGRRDQVLTDALRKLQDEGLVQQRGFGRKRSTYQLTSLGVAVRDVIVELRAYDRNSLAALQPGTGRVPSTA
jgi:DNA-binding HxlR family transcriptional regulator